MDERYNIYFAGQVMDGFELHAVRDKLAKVFNADQATLDKLFSGKAQLIKRDCDAATASKFKQALERAGAIPVIKRVELIAEPIVESIAESKVESNAPSAATATNNEPARTPTAAEKIAALAAAPEGTRYQTVPAGSSTAVDQIAPAAVRGDTVPGTGGIALAPPGTAVLREDERAEPVFREVDTSRLAVDVTATRLSEEAPPPPAAPDTGHLSMGAVGETIPNLPSTAAPLSPNLDGLALSAAGTDFSDCVRPAPLAPSLDLSGLAALAPGDMPLEEQHRRPIPVATPSIDHISLED